MRHDKLDAGLAAALADPLAEEFLVSVRTARRLTRAEQDEFQQLGGVASDAPLPVLSARVSRAGLDALSEQAWVFRVSLARRLRPA
jgi:hypothetical protein